MLAAENIFESEHVYLEEDLLGHEKIPDKKGGWGHRCQFTLLMFERPIDFGFQSLFYFIPQLG